MATSIAPIFGPPVPATYTPSGSPQAGQVNLLKQRGENPSEIAAILGVSVATVDNDLGIPARGAAAAAIPAQTPFAQTAFAGSRLSVFA